MKKLLSLFVPLLALFLTLSPQTAKATQYIKLTEKSGAYARADVTLVGSWTAADVAKLHIKYSTNGSSWSNATSCTSGNAGKYKCGCSSLIKNSALYISMTPDADILAEISPTKYVQIGISAQACGSKVEVEGNIMALLYGTDDNSTFANRLTIPTNYCFYRLFTGITANSSGSTYDNNINIIDFSKLTLPATTLTKACYADMFLEIGERLLYGPTTLPAVELADSCYAGMFRGCKPTTSGGYNKINNFTTAPEIKAISLTGCSGDVTSACKNMFSGCSALTTITTHFLSWGSTDSPTENWLPSASWSGTFNGTSSLAAKSSQSGTGSASITRNVTPNVYIFNLNGGTWDGTCSLDKYYTTAAPTVPTPYGSSFDGWYTASSGGSPVTPSSLSAPSGLTTYYAHYLSSASYTLTITTPTHGTLVVKDNGDNTISSGASVTEGTTLTLTAIPAAGYRFKRYTGNATSGTFTMPGENATIGVEFEEDLCEVTIASPSNGSLTASDGTNNYSAGTTYSFNRQTDAGKVLTFTATPASHYTFSSWTDASSLLTNKTSTPYTDGQVCTAQLTIGNSSPLTYTVGASFTLSQYTITTSATNGTVTGGGTYEYGTVISLVPLGASHYSFLKWSDENTDNPRSVTVTGNASYTAIFEFNPSSVSSADAAATIYQAGTGAGGKKILYSLDPVTVGGITYTPIDLGYGVAWADRNIGAANITDAGGYFYYGGTTPIYPGTAGSSSTYYSGVSSMSANDNLPMTADAAYQIMGTNWRIPTSTEWNQLLNNGAYNNTTLSANFTASQNSRTGNGIITSKTDPTKSITLPGVGLIRNYTYTQMSSYMCYWSSTLAVTGSSTAIPYHLYIYNGKTLASGTGNAVAWHSLPIRAIYSPDYPICTLTIISGAYTYIYLCEIGQKVTITATPNDGYVFNKWSEDNNTNAIRTFTVMEDATYTATFKEATTYAITFVDEDGSTILDGPKDVAEGVVPTYNGETPTKAATAQYTYTFNSWSPALYAADKAQTYTATYTGTPVNYTLAWVTDGDELTGDYTAGTIAYGTTITAPNTPTKDGYAFNGWDADNDGTADEVAATMPTNDITYKALWTAASPNITLCENCDNDHYNTFKSDYDGETVNVTYPRQFSASKWSTMCLPFSLDLATMIANKMYGRVYEFKYATGNANTNSGVNLYFSNAKKIEAGTCYIVNANAELAAKTSFVFIGVTIDLSKDNGAALTSVGAYNNLPGYLSEGTIELVGTLRNGTLKGSATGNKYMGLKNNKIYYPNTDTGSTIWAYRGIFRSSEILDKQSMQKMRIIVDGEDRGELIIDADGDILAPSDAPSRKFIRDGVLYIEREGVVYDAQGKRVESSF